MKYSKNRYKRRLVCNGCEKKKIDEAKLLKIQEENMKRRRNEMFKYCIFNVIFIDKCYNYCQITPQQMSILSYVLNQIMKNNYKKEYVIPSSGSAFEPYNKN